MKSPEEKLKRMLSVLRGHMLLEFISELTGIEEWKLAQHGEDFPRLSLQDERDLVDFFSKLGLMVPGRFEELFLE